MKTLLTIALLVPALAQAAVVKDAAELKKDANLCKARVVDARGAADASQLPVPGSLSYSHGVRVTEEKVLVIADDEKSALAAAEELEKSNPGLSAVAVKGGYDALREARPKAKLPNSNLATLIPTFNIPNDTCQTGKPLHVFKGIK